jgi:hypothetical protein
MLQLLCRHSKKQSVLSEGFLYIQTIAIVIFLQFAGAIANNAGFTFLKKEKKLPNMGAFFFGRQCSFRPFAIQLAIVKQSVV